MVTEAKKPEKLTKATCFECDRTRPINMMLRMELWDSPFDEKPREVYLCKVKPTFYKYVDDCLELLEDQSWADFRYFRCAGCGREVCRQNPRNGWHSQVRTIGDSEFCLKCYEEHILENGVEREEFEEGHLPGMFFSGDNHEPLDAGYETVLYNFKVTGTESAKVVCSQAIALIDSGHKVVVGYEQMAIGGLEGYVSLFAKKE